MPPGPTGPDARDPDLEWARCVDRAFARLLELPADARVRRLRKLDRNAPRLASELRRLLRLSHQATTGFERSLDGLARSVLRSVDRAGGPTDRAPDPHDPT